MKKAITLALVAALLTATGITAYATDITADSNPKTGGTTVNYTVDPAYTVVIPESVTLGDTAVTEQIKIYGATENDNVVIGKGQKVNVALTESANNFNVANTDGDTIAYTVNDKNAVADLTTVAECAANTTSETELTFAKTGTAAYAGTYTDTLTFTVSLEDAAYVPKTFTSLSDGDILRVGDTLEVASGEYIFPDDGCSLMAWNAPFTVLRANVDVAPGMRPIVTEDVNGACYVIKGNENNYFAFGGRLAATDTSDGVIITKNGSNWAINVYEP